MTDFDTAYPTDFTVRADYAAGLTITEIAVKYGMSVPWVSDIVLRRVRVARPKPPKRIKPGKKRAVTPRPVMNLALPENYPAGWVSRGVIH